MGDRAPGKTAPSNSAHRAETQTPFCPGCGEIVEAAIPGGRPRVWCEQCRGSQQAASRERYRARVQAFEIACAECGDTFTVTTTNGNPAGRAGRGVQRFCKHECKTRHLFRLKYAAGGGRRHGRVNGKARLAVFDRDGWRCQLCHAPIDARLKFPAPGSPTIDHIVALADGGPHEPANWQAAHLICNVDKGNANRRKVAA